MVRPHRSWFLATFALCAPLHAQTAPEIRWEPYTGRAADGSALEGRLGRIRVPENRTVADGPSIELAFVVYASTAAEPGPPIVFLVGGPGGPGIETCAAVATDPCLALLVHGDVIGIDQRGTGASVPNLADAPPFGYELPLDRAATRAEVIDAYTDAVARCCAYWSDQGVDLAAYNTRESADDVDAVRAALGHERVTLYGTSYGSHLGLAYLRRHPEHAARAVLMKVEGPDDTFKLPSTVQRHLECLSAIVAADPTLGAAMPDLTGTVRALLARLEREPATFTVERDDEELTIAVGAFDLRTIVASALGDTRNASTLPMALDLMRQGEWRHTLRMVLANRQAEVGSAMSLAMDCASGATPDRRARIERERLDPANLLADAIDAPRVLDACVPCEGRDLGDAFRAPFECDVPTLFVSGTLDARTPPENVAALAAGFAHHAHVLVTNTGHDAREEGSEEYCTLVRAFLAGDPVASATIELPPLEFAPLRTR